MKDIWHPQSGRTLHLVTVEVDTVVTDVVVMTVAVDTVVTDVAVVVVDTTIVDVMIEVAEEENAGGKRTMTLQPCAATVC